MPHVLLASCAQARGLDNDESLLLAALADAGASAVAADWADPTVDWAAADADVVRSTWDYAPRRDEFLAWARRVEAATPLHNPAAVLAWNTDKRYLTELAADGLAVVPTGWATPGWSTSTARTATRSARARCSLGSRSAPACSPPRRSPPGRRPPPS